ncbi:putative alpha-1,3-glucanase/mutanase [Sclerotinia borealis F-4128]|uniref:Putative alpha-1,3-glucanase/mutanase n=1 Tax=Sclerotinia borealis (strain F-4128) TaxID=1432307 RepID=W9C5L1_SCLBF|nr:putative alpha-1,3-glucanase/mutanase [Sclerotinia borealis F-4128]
MGALSLSPGVVDGLLSWAAWPWGGLDINTYVDASYLEYLKIFSSSNPLHDLWYDRWQEVWVVQPEFVEILTWNDYGESHYIGPLHDEALEAFDIGEAPFNYVTKMPHDGWRMFLPYFIDTYKNGIATIEQEGLAAWYRLTPKAACADGGTTENTASQLQVEFYPIDIVQDKIFYSALLGSSQSVRVTVGGVDLDATWTSKPDGDVGIYHGSVAYGGALGEIVVTVGSMVMSGEAITTSCDRVNGQDGLTNWNAWVGSASGSTVSATPALNLTEQVCILGTGVAAYKDLCSYSCHLGYCLIGACTCLAMGKQLDQPDATGIKGYPAAGLDATYSGLCDFACNLDFCPSESCDTVKHELVIQTVSPFLPSACTNGTGVNDLQGLCEYSCVYGFCPIHSCTCTEKGALNVPPPTTGASGKGTPGLDPLIYDAICEFTCSRGYCPEGPCSPAGTNSGTGDFLVYVSPSIWINPEPIVQLGCYPPCTLILPPFTLPAPTVINFDPYVTTLEVFSITGTTTITYTNTAAGTIFVSEIIKGTSSMTTTTILVPPLTTDVIDFWNIPIDDADDKASLILISTSILPPIVTITETSAGTAYDRTIHPPPWPYTQSTPTKKSSSSSPPPYVSYTSSAAKSRCTSDCGTRCIGLFCNLPCLFDCVKIPDPDLWDPKDPDSPYSPSKTPYKPEDSKCTTTSASSCRTECLAASPTSTCSSSCSISYGCSVTSTSTLGTYTLAPFGYWTADSFDRASDSDAAYVSSVDAAITAQLEEWFPITGITATATVTPVSTITGPNVTITVTPTPTADCSFWDEDSLYFAFDIYNIKDWAVDDSGASLKKQETGCGALQAYARFNLPTVLKAGCVERAIASAGGPKISCHGGGIAGLKKRSVRRSERTFRKASYKAPSVTPTYTSQVDAADARPTYIPEYWNATLPTASVNAPEGHGVVKNWMMPTPDNHTSAYTMYTVAMHWVPIGSHLRKPHPNTIFRRKISGRQELNFGLKFTLQSYNTIYNTYYSLQANIAPPIAPPEVIDLVNADYTNPQDPETPSNFKNRSKRRQCVFTNKALPVFKLGNRAGTNAINTTTEAFKAKLAVYEHVERIQQKVIISLVNAIDKYINLFATENKRTAVRKLSSRVIKILMLTIDDGLNPSSSPIFTPPATKSAISTKTQTTKTYTGILKTSKTSQNGAGRANLSIFQKALSKAPPTNARSKH